MAGHPAETAKKWRQTICSNGFDDGSAVSDIISAALESERWDSGYQRAIAHSQ